MINFNKESHQYFLGDKELISVSEVLLRTGATSPVPNIPAIQEAALYGTAKHRVLAEALTNPFFEVDDLDTEDKEHYEFFMEVINNLQITELDAEQIVYNQDWGIAGTADIIAKSRDGRTTVIDHKFTSRFHKHHLYQVCIYALLQNPNAAVESNCYVINYKTKEFFTATNEDFKKASKIIAAFLCGEKIAERTIDTTLQMELRKRMVDLQLAQARLEEIKLQIIEEVGAESMKTDLISVVYKKAYEKKTFDSKKALELLKPHYDEKELQSLYKIGINKESYAFSLVNTEDN